MIQCSLRGLTMAIALSALTNSASAQQKGTEQLLPLPQHIQTAKGVFKTTTPIKVENQVGDTAQNVFIQPWAATSSADAKRVVRYTQLSNATSAEAYRLHVGTDTIEVSAASREGFMNAWHTIAQLSTKKGVPCADIVDEPAYKWRGLMIDVVRHFFPISFLKEQINVMASYKFNRLHLHLTDAEGWRMEIKRYPRLTDSIAYRPIEPWLEWREAGTPYCSKDAPGAYGGYYTQDELRDLVAYAAERGITIVPEIEMPGHSGAVLTAYPELSCTHEPHKQSDYCAGSIATYDFLENVLTEVMDVFPSHYIHVGGDEAAKKSWPTCPLCQMKMRELGTDNINDLQAYFITRMGQFLNRFGRQLVGWDEVTAGDLSKNTTVMVWRGTNRAHEAIKHGYDVVLSPTSHCYFDLYQDAPALQLPAFTGYIPLEKVYSYVPGGDLPEAERKLVTGVQGNLWTEHVATTEHVEQMLWPRGMALAEIGWNGTPKKNYTEFRKRALHQVEVLRSKGQHPFDLKHEVGQRPEALKPAKNKALGAKVVYNKPMNKSYTAGGEQALVDGKRGGWAYSDGRWQAFTGSPEAMDVTIDLGKTTSLSGIEIGFMQMTRPGVNLPSQVTVALSTDGETFTQVYSKDEPQERTLKTLYRTHAWRGHKSARYIRVKAKASTFGGFIMCDEVIVK